MAVAPDLVGIRDSKNADGPCVTVPAEAWTTFLSSL
ncbi:DUF397 domain-containing protein [Kibdelosporangium persicum]